MRVEARRREGSDEQRCPICHGSVAPSEPSWECPECAAVHHGACAREHKKCASLGCRGAPRSEGLAPRDPVADLRAWRWHLVKEGVYFTLVLAAAVFSIAGIVVGLTLMQKGEIVTSGSIVPFTPLALIALFALVGFRMRHER